MRRTRSSRWRSKIQRSERHDSGYACVSRGSSQASDKRVTESTRRNGPRDSGGQARRRHSIRAHGHLTTRAARALLQLQQEPRWKSNGDRVSPLVDTAKAMLAASADAYVIDNARTALVARTQRTSSRRPYDAGRPRLAARSRARPSARIDRRTGRALDRRRAEAVSDRSMPSRRSTRAPARLGALSGKPTGASGGRRTDHPGLASYAGVSEDVQLSEARRRALPSQGREEERHRRTRAPDGVAQTSRTPRSASSRHSPPKTDVAAPCAISSIFARLVIEKDCATSLRVAYVALETADSRRSRRSRSGSQGSRDRSVHAA